MLMLKSAITPSLSIAILSIKYHLVSDTHHMPVRHPFAVVLQPDGESG